MRSLALLIAAALVLGGCSATSADPEASGPRIGSVEDIEIGGSGTLAPSLAFPAEIEWTREEASVVWDGDGEALADGEPLLLDIYGASLLDGTTIVNTYDGLPRSMLLAPEVVGDVLYETLMGAHVGARLLVIAPAEEEAGDSPPVAMVVDVLPEHAVGAEVAPTEGLPTVTLLPTGEPEIDLGDVEPTADLQVATLIRGSGAQIRDGSFVTVNYKAVYLTDGSDEDGEWKSGDVFESSWPAEKAPFELQLGAGQVIRGWEEGLIDQTAGSQVLMVVPASLGYATKGTLVFVVDILDVWNAEG